MSSPARTEQHDVDWAGRFLLVLPCAVVAALSSQKADWHPIWLFLGLAAATIASDLLVVVINRNLTVSAALVSVVLAGTFLGPLPAAVIGAGSSIFDGVHRGIGPRRWIWNCVFYFAIGLSAGLLARALDIRAERGLALGAEVGLLYAGASAASLVLSLVGTTSRWASSIREEAPATAPAEGLLAAAAAMAALLYRDGEYAALISLAAVALLFNYFAGSLVRARLYAAEMRGLAARESRLTARLAESQSLARRDLADVLHSGPIQTLLSVRQDLEERAVARAHDGVVASIRELRDLMVDLNVPHAPGNPGASLDGLSRALGQRYGINVELDLQLGDSSASDSRQMRLAFDAAQELIRNAAKHAGATTVLCSLHRSGDAILLEATDDGIGLDEATIAVAVADGHVGLAALRARVRDENGEFVIRRSVEGGTSVRIVLPLAD